MRLFAIGRGMRLIGSGGVFLVGDVVMDGVGRGFRLGFRAGMKGDVLRRLPHGLRNIDRFGLAYLRGGGQCGCVGMGIVVMIFIVVMAMVIMVRRTMRVIVVVVMIGMVMIMVVVIVRPIFVMFGMVEVMFTLVQVFVVMAFLGVRFGGQSFRGRSLGRGIEARGFDDPAPDPLAVAATSRIAMARTSATGAVFRFFLGFAMGALIGLDQRLTVGDRDLVIIGMNFAEGEKAVAVAAIFNERGLQRWFDAGDLRQINIAAQLFALRSFEIKFFDAIAADHDDPGLLRVGGIDKHLVGHFVTLDGGGRAVRRAQIARPGDATVHLIRG
jgi:hypothetical protein